MIRVLFAFILCSTGMFFFLGSPYTVGAASAPDPTEQFRPFVEKIVSILTDPEMQGDEKCIERRAKVRAVGEERFDFNEMSKRVLGSTWRKLNADEQKHFVDLFTKLLEHAYFGKIEDYSKQTVVFKDQRVQGDRAQINTGIIDKDVNISVSYVMLLQDGVWRVYDIIVEGVSLVRNYMEQFKEILRKEGYASLLKQVEAKVTELDEGIGIFCPVDIPEKKDT